MAPQSSSSGLLPPTSTPESADDEVSDEDSNEQAFKRRFFQQQDLRRRSNTADSTLKSCHNVPSVLHRQDALNDDVTLVIGYCDNVVGNGKRVTITCNP